MVRILERSSDPEMQPEYLIDEMWSAMQLVYDQADPHYALAYEAVRICLSLVIDEKMHLSRVEAMWATAQKADAARPCKAATPAPIIAANRRTP
jgi:hypothetical protein